MKNNETSLIDHLERLSIETKQTIEELKAIQHAKKEALVH